MPGLSAACGSLSLELLGEEEEELRMALQGLCICKYRLNVIEHLCVLVPGVSHLS